jgi:TetR/AcrR family transcriptional repressor of nem operon
VAVAGRKQFSTEEALRLATDFFRRNGYAGSSMDDLVRHTGVGRGSLYATFGNKEQLFLSTLDQYCRTMMARLQIDEAQPPRQAMGKFLADLLDAIQSWGPGGCLVTNTCAEYLTVPTSAQERINAALAEQEDQLLRYFRRAARRGELPPGRSPQHLAALFVAVRQSLCLLWKAGQTTPRLTAVAQASLHVLDGPPTAADPGRGPGRAPA